MAHCNAHVVMAASINVRARLAAELKRLVRDAREWPMRDRRRFRNLLLDAVSSDAMPMAELLLRAHDDGLLRAFPDRSAPRAAWDAATARVVGDLQAQRFVEPGIARFVAEAWAAALGPDIAPSARVATPRPVGARSGGAAAGSAPGRRRQCRVQRWAARRIHGRGGSQLRRVDARVPTLEHDVPGRRGVVHGADDPGLSPDGSRAGRGSSAACGDDDAGARSCSR